MEPGCHPEGGRSPAPLPKAKGPFPVPFSLFPFQTSQTGLPRALREQLNCLLGTGYDKCAGTNDSALRLNQDSGVSAAQESALPDVTVSRGLTVQPGVSWVRAEAPGRPERFMGLLRTAAPCAWRCRSTRAALETRVYFRVFAGFAGLFEARLCINPSAIKIYLCQAWKAQ